MTQKPNLVVIGTGMAAQKFVKELDKISGTSLFNVTVVAGKSEPGFDWLHRPSMNETNESGWASDAFRRIGANIPLSLNTRTQRIDRMNKTIETTGNATLPYDYLVVATGASPVLPDIEGYDLDGVFTYQREEDLKEIKAFTSRSRRATVLGGGLLGFKAAKACVDAGVETTLLEYEDLLMPRQLNDQTGLLNKYMTSLGINVRTDARPKCLTGNTRVACLRLIGDAVIPTDLVILCADIRPNDHLAEAAGIPVAEEGGIIVDSQLRTTDPSIFAIGECASFNGMVCGLVSPGFSMAATLAGNLCGQSKNFEGPDTPTKLRRLGLDPAHMEDPPSAKPTKRLRINRCYVDRPSVF